MKATYIQIPHAGDAEIFSEVKNSVWDIWEGWVLWCMQN